MSKIKFKINQLAAKPIDVELEHPTEGKTGIIVKMCGPHSKQFKEAATVFRNLEKPTDEDHLKLFTSCLMGWDEEAFDQPFSVEAANAMLIQPESQWIMDFLAPMVRDHKLFFRPQNEQAA